MADKLTDIDLTNEEPKSIEDSIDVLSIYYGKSFELECGITIHQPTIKEIREFGEQRFWQTAVKLCSNPTSYRVILWDAGIDWNKVDDFDLFYSLCKDIPVEDTRLIFGDLDLRQFRPIEDDDKNMILMYIPDPDIQLDKNSYLEMVAYLRIFFGIHPKVEKAIGKTTKEIIIYDEKNRAQFKEMNEKKTVWDNSTLFSLISSAVNQAGFKYNIQECEELTIFQFLDAIKRISVDKSSSSAMYGMYSGMIDVKKSGIEKELNWTRNLYD